MYRTYIKKRTLFLSGMLQIQIPLPYSTMINACALQTFRDIETCMSISLKYDDR